MNDFPPIREYMHSMFHAHVAEPADQNQGLPSSSSLTSDNPDDSQALGGGDEGSNGSGDFNGSRDESQAGLEWDDSDDEGSLPHKEPKKSDPTASSSHRSRESSKEPMQVDEPGAPSSSTSSSALAQGDEDDQEEDEVMESSADVGSSSKSSNVPPQVQSRTLLDWTMTDEDGAGASELGTGDNSNNASTTGTPDPEASLWIFGGLIHSFKSAYEADPDSQETMSTFRQVCEVYEAGVGVESADMAQMFGQEICMFARKCSVPESYATIRNRSSPLVNRRRAQDQDEPLEEGTGVMGALMTCLWRITEKEGRQGAERVAQMLSSCEASVESSERLLSMWYLIGIVHDYRSSASSRAPITLEDSLSLYGSYLQNVAERDSAQAPDEEGAEMDQEERVKSLVQEYLVRDLQNVQDRQPNVFDAVVPLVLQYLPDYIPRTESFLRMVIFLATPTQIYCLSLGLSQRQFVMFSSLPSGDGAPAKDKGKKKNDVQEDLGSPSSIHSSLASGWEPRVGPETVEVIGQTLEWGTFDQMGIWQLIVSEFGGFNKAITGLLNASWVPAMTSVTQAEALGGLLNLIRTLSLSPPDIRLGTTIVRIASRTDLVSYDMMQFCQRWIGQSASTYPDHLGAILLSLSDRTAVPIWEDLDDLGLGTPSSSVPTTPITKPTRSRIGGSGGQSKRTKLTVKQRKEQGTLLRTALSLVRGWCEALSEEVTRQHFLRVWSAQVRSQVLDALTENFGVNEKEAWPKDWWIKDEDNGSQNDEDMESRHSDEDDDDDDKEDDDDDEDGGRGNSNSSNKKKKSEDEEDDESDQDQQSSDSDRRKKDQKRFGGAASRSASSSRRNSPKIGSGSSSTMGSNASTPAASKKGSSAGVLNSKSRSTRATAASTKKATPAKKAAASRRRKISEDDDDEEEVEEEEARDDEEVEEEEEEEAPDEEMDEDEKSEKDGEEEGSNDEESEEETKGKKGKGKRPAKKAAVPATPAKRAATTRSQVKKPAAKPLTRSNRRTRKQEESEEDDEEEDEDEDEENESEEEEEEGGDQENGDGKDEDDDDEEEEEEEEEEETAKKGKLPVYTQRRAAANANSKLKAASAATVSSAPKAKAAPKSRAKNKRRIVTDDESE